MRNRRFCSLGLMAAGLALIACALLLMGNNLREQARGEQSASLALAQLQLAMSSDSAPQEEARADAGIPVPEAADPAKQASEDTVLPASTAAGADMATAAPGSAAAIGPAEAAKADGAAISGSAGTTPPEDAAMAGMGPAQTPALEAAAGGPDATPAPEAAATSRPAATIAPEDVSQAEPVATPMPAGPTVLPATVQPGAAAQAGAAGMPSARPVLPIYTPEPTPEPLFLQNPDMQMPVEKVGGNEYIGILEVPSLGLELPVMSDWSYPKLRSAPCRYTGSAYSGDLIISGHNYDRHFGGLWKLQTGDEVRFTDVEGHVFLYRVCKTETLKKTDVQKMRSGDWDMTLFTCTYGGKSRVTIRCEFVRYG